MISTIITDNESGVDRSNRRTPSADQPRRRLTLGNVARSGNLVCPKQASRPRFQAPSVSWPDQHYLVNSKVSNGGILFSRTTRGECMRYWLNLFSPRTWEDFTAHGSNITGFSENNWTRAKRIQVGDLFLCYLIGAKRWIGALRVAGDRYHDEGLLFRDAVYPVRFPVEPIVALDLECGVPIENLRGKLSFFPADGDYKDWS